MTNVQKAYDAVYRNNEFNSNLVVSSLNFKGGYYFHDMQKERNQPWGVLPEPFLIAQFGESGAKNATSIKHHFDPNANPYLRAR